jgi:hypothetical protein
MEDTTLGDTTFGDWFVANPDLQKWIRSNVHPADRERMQLLVYNGEHSVEDVMLNRVTYRKMPKPGV